MFFNSINCVEKTNKKWEVLHADRALTIPYKKIFSMEDKFFTIGSCFAEEIRKALTRDHISCLPFYSKINFDPNRAIVDTLPLREHMNFYNTFSIKQEFSRAVGSWVQEADDYWTLKGKKIIDGRLHNSPEPSDTVYQDPYRRLVFADTPTHLNEVTNKITAIFRQGLKDATVLVITLGMTEVFKKKNNGKVCNQVPIYGGGGGLREAEFYNSSFADNLSNVQSLLNEVKAFNPKLRVVLTVSPVPLHRSFGPNDIFVNNYASKCTLRAVAEQICNEYDWVHYFPSFEVVWNLGSTAYLEKDLLHVKPEIVGLITTAFRKSFFN
jgi:hypothetical protein